MRQMGLQTKGRRRFRVTTQRDEGHRHALNLLAGDFKATRPNEKWLSDISAIPTHEDWLCLAGIQDAFSRRIVGWSNEVTEGMCERVTKELVCDAWRMGGMAHRVCTTSIRVVNTPVRLICGCWKRLRCKSA